MRYLLGTCFVVGCIYIIVYSYGCADGTSSDQLRINLRWIKSFPNEKKENVITGIKWNLSFLGAMLPKGSFKKAVRWKNETTFILDLSKVGFDQPAETALIQFLKVIKESQEYQKFDAIDLGRFIMLMFNSPHHYYAITGANEKFSSFSARFVFEDKKAAIIESSIAVGNRLIEISRAEKFSEIAFVGLEGEGSVEEGTFEIREFEAMDFMPNGQLRFALYDSKGNLESATTPSMTAAGKPAKCLWCHELGFVPPFEDDHTLLGYYSSVDFKNILMDRRETVLEYRKELNSEIDFTDLQAHTQAELLYLAFMEPSAERLAQEWGLSVSETQKRLQGFETHPQHEFKYLGDHLYYRHDIDSMAPYENIVVSDDAREYSAYEPDFIRH